MIDINFYMKIWNLKQKLMTGNISENYAWRKLEEIRSRNPVICNIETTNACNMRCIMCPRTTMMTRPIETMDMKTYQRIVDQIEPFSDGDWRRWENFVETHYQIPKEGMGVNHFFLYVIVRAIILHGFGEPLLDKKMSERIDLLSRKKIPSYFSCNPANINIPKMLEMFQSGLGYVKFSIESINDSRHKRIRGGVSNFTDSCRKIMDLINLKSRNNYQTVIVITMLDFKKSAHEEEWQKLREVFKGIDVYMYLTERDQNWYQGKQKKAETVHWSEFCQFPWSSMTVKSNGEVAMCQEDFNNEIILGDTKSQPLYDIWNGEKYHRFRRDHFKLTSGIKCTEQCDMTLVGELTKVKK